MKYILLFLTILFSGCTTYEYVYQDPIYEPQAQSTFVYQDPIDYVIVYRINNRPWERPWDSMWLTHNNFSRRWVYHRPLIGCNDAWMPYWNNYNVYNNWWCNCNSGYFYPGYWNPYMNHHYYNSNTFYHNYMNSYYGNAFYGPRGSRFNYSRNNYYNNRMFYNRKNLNNEKEVKQSTERKPQRTTERQYQRTQTRDYTPVQRTTPTYRTVPTQTNYQRTNQNIQQPRRVTYPSQSRPVTRPTRSVAPMNTPSRNVPSRYTPSNVPSRNQMPSKGVTPKYPSTPRQVKPSQVPNRGRSVSPPKTINNKSRNQ